MIQYGSNEELRLPLRARKVDAIRRNDNAGENYECPEVSGLRAPAGSGR